MADVQRPLTPPREFLRPFDTLGLSAFSLGLFLSWALLAGGRRFDFLLLLPILALAVLAPRWVGLWRGGEALVRGGVGLAAALILGLTLLRQPQADAVALTVPLFLALTVGVTVVLQRVLSPRASLGVILTALAALAGLGLAFKTDAAQALGDALQAATLWGLLAIVTVGVLALGRVERRWLQLALYAVAIAALAGFLQWGGPLAALTRIRGGLLPLELRAASFLPAFIIIGGSAQIILALLLPRVPWRRVAQTDLAAHLLLLGVPIVADLLPLRRPLYFEGDFRVAWLALFLIGLLLIRLLIAIGFILRAASTDAPALGGTVRGRETRLALAFFVFCFAAYWPATLWRGASYGLVGDEPSYLAATMSLWNKHNLELTDSLFSSEMTAILADPQGERDLHVYEDGSADRMLFNRNLGTPRRDLYFPLVAAPGMTSAVELVNPDLESAGGDILFRDAAGTVVEKRAVLVEPGRSLLLLPPPNPAGPLSATILVGKPIGAAARLTVPGGGTETYFGGAVTPRHCLPFDLDPARWQAQALIQNGFPSEAVVAWTRYDAAGTALNQGKVTIPADGVAALAADLNGGLGSLCLAADGPVAAALVARATPGLIVVQSAPAAAARIDIPERHTTLGYLGERSAIIHNPSSSEMVYLTLDREGFPKGQQVAIEPHGTWSFAVSYKPAIITTDDPVMVSILETIGAHAAAVTPEGTAATALIIPAIDIGRDGYAVSQIELTNAGTEPVQATLNLTDGAGKTLWSDKIWVEANGTTSKPFWYKGDDSRFLSIQARTPLTATLLQREIRTERPVHGLGLSLALLPGYAAGGYDGVLASLAALAALVALALYELLRRIGLDARVAVGVAALIACSSPLSPAAVRLYAEVGGTLFLLLALLCIDNWRSDRWSPLLTVPLTLLCFAGTTLFHSRLLPAVLVIAGMGVLLELARLAGLAGGLSWRRWAGVGLFAAMSVGLLAVAAIGAMRFEPRLQPSYLRTFLAASSLGPQSFGILFDRASGLFPAAPVLLMATGGFVWLARRASFLGWTALLVVIGQFLAIAVRGGGWETWGPPARYIYPAVPFLTLAFGAAWQWGFARPTRLIGGVLAAFGLLVTAFSWWLPLGLHYGIGDANPYWFADRVLPPLLGVNPFLLFPALASTSSPPWRAVLPWLGLLLGSGLLAIRWHSGKPLPAPLAATTPSSDRAFAVRVNANGDDRAIVEVGPQKQEVS
ncbi:MAG TPA: hypothetical protein VIL85_16775 [Thermomicrobiales bacterium]